MNQLADGLHQTAPDTYTLIRNGHPTHTIRVTWHNGVRSVQVDTMKTRPPSGKEPT